jgi:SAM-dependent methyltransferase
VRRGGRGLGQDGWVETGDAAARAAQRDLVRRGYDAISLAYRGDDGSAAASSAEDVSRYAGWIEELARLLPADGRVVDLGCGAGLPATRELTGRGLQVLGVDFSAVQLHRARALVPAASLVRADIAELRLRPASADAVVSFYALIHVPLADQQALFRVSAAGCALAATFWPSSVPVGGPGPRTTSAPACSGTTLTPARTSDGSRPRGWSRSGTGLSRKAAQVTAWSSPGPHRACIGVRLGQGRRPGRMSAEPGVSVS